MKLFLILFFSILAQSQESEPEYLVEDTPLELFTDRAHGWNYEAYKKTYASDTSLHDTLIRIPGIFSQGEVSGGNPSIRIRAANSVSRSLMLFDGTPLNTADGLGANSLLLPMELVGQIDIIKGPASTLYGSSAVGGAINLKPQRFLNPLIRVGYESFGKPSFFGASPIISGDKSHLQTSIYLESFDGNFQYDDPTLGKTKRKNNGHNRQRYSLLGEHKISKIQLQHQLIYAYENAQAPGSIASSFATHYDRNAWLANLSAKSSLASNLMGTIKTSYLQTDNINSNSFGKTDFFSSKSVNDLSFEYNLSKHNFELLTQYHYDHFKNVPTVDRRYEDHFEHAFYYRGAITDRESLVLGLRYFPDENELIKNLTLQQDNSSYKLWASYSEGLNTPSLTQRFTNDPWVVGNPGLDVEKSNQIELGIGKKKSDQKNYFWDFLDLELSLYTIEYKNFIEYLSTPTPYSFVNIQDVEAQGIDFKIKWDHLIYHSEISYSFMKAQDEATNNDLFLLPRHQAFFLVGAQMSFIITELRNTYWSSFKSDTSNPNKKEPSWLSTDLIFRTSGLNNWEVQVGAKNIFNNRKSLTEGYPEPGRSFFAYIQRSF